MRLSERCILQYIEAGGMADFYNLANTDNGAEFELTTTEMAHLFVGLTYFVQSDAELREQVAFALQQLTGQAVADAREVLIGTLGMLDPTIADPTTAPVR